MTYRVERLNSFLRQEISDIVQRYVKDPSLHFRSVTTVEISKDMRYAKVYQPLRTDLEKSHTNKSADDPFRYIRHELGEE